MKSKRPVILPLLAIVLLAVIVAGPALAQKADPGPFAKGMKRAGITGGAGSTLGQTYVILGGSFGYFLVDGLELGAGVEGWLFQSPTLWKLTPQMTYIFYQMDKIKPYAGGFYRWTLVGEPYEDYESYGYRIGVSYRQGRSFVALGMVNEYYVDDEGLDDSSIWYPEIAFWFSF
jgi:hypothetical protein